MSMRLRIAFLLFLQFVVLPAFAGQAPEPPWSVGSSVEGWRLQSIERHPEYLRLYFHMGPQTTGVEIRVNPGVQDEWSTAAYRVQPCPDQEPPENLLKALLADVQKLDRGKEDQNQAGGLGLERLEHEAFRYQGPSRPVLNTDYLISIAALLFVLGVLGWCFVSLIRQRPELRFIGLGLVWLAALWTALVFHFSDMFSPLLDLATPLQQGTTWIGVQQLFLAGQHEGPLFVFLCHSLPFAKLLPFQQVVLMNIWLFGLNALVFCFAAFAVLGGWFMPLLFTIMTVMNPVMLNTAFSEQPSSWMFLIFFSIAAVIVRFRVLRRQVSESVPAMAALAILLVMLFLSRKEMLIPVLGAAASVLWIRLRFLKRRGKAEPVEAKNKELWRTPVLAAISLVILPLSLKFAVEQEQVSPLFAFMTEILYMKINPEQASPVILFIHELLQTKENWLLESVSPGNLSYLLLPGYFANFMPLGLVFLGLLGFLSACLRMAKLPFLLSILLLINLYFVGAHGNISDFFQFATYLLPPFLFLTLLGWREIRELPMFQRFPARYRKPLLAMLGAALILPTGLVNLKEPYSVWIEHSPSALPLVSANEQRELRYMADLVRRYPKARFVTYTLRKKTPENMKQRVDVFLFGSALHDFRRCDGTDRACLESLGLNDSTQELYFYYGLDCHLRDDDICPQEMKTAAWAESVIFDSVPYSPQWEWGYMRDKITLAAFPIKPGSLRFPVEPATTNQE